MLTAPFCFGSEKEMQVLMQSQVPHHSHKMGNVLLTGIHFSVCWAHKTSAAATGVADPTATGEAYVSHLLPLP